MHSLFTNLGVDFGELLEHSGVTLLLLLPNLLESLLTQQHLVARRLVVRFHGQD